MRAPDPIEKNRAPISNHDKENRTLLRARREESRARFYRTWIKGIQPRRYAEPETRGQGEGGGKGGGGEEEGQARGGMARLITTLYPGDTFDPASARLSAAADQRGCGSRGDSIPPKTTRSHGRSGAGDGSRYRDRAR